MTKPNEDVECPTTTTGSTLSSTANPTANDNDDTCNTAPLSALEVQRTRSLLQFLSSRRGRESLIQSELDALLKEEAVPEEEDPESSLTNNAKDGLKEEETVEESEEDYVREWMENSKMTQKAVKDYILDEDLLPSDTFSFFMTSKIHHTPFILAFMVMALTFFTYAVVTVGIVDFSDDDNPFQIPAGVTGAVRISQMVSILLSIISAEGITDSLRIARNGWTYELLREEYPEVAGESNAQLTCRWYAQFCLRFISGCYGQGLTFILIIQSDTVLDVLLNYAAMAFISTIDNQIFILGRATFFGAQVRLHCSLVMLSFTPADAPPQCWRRFLHLIGLVLLYVVLLISWIYVVARQDNGDYLCSTILVEFGDEVNPILGAFSGLYDRVHHNRKSIFSPKRVQYVERRSGAATFAYCDDENRWVFRYSHFEGGVDFVPSPTVPSINITDLNEYIMQTENYDLNFCEGPDAFTSTTVAFDLLETTGANKWFAKNQHERVVPLRELGLEIECYDCGQQSFTNCGGKGTCIPDLGCVCDDGWFGTTCQLREPCEYLNTDVRGGEFQSTRTYSSEYTLVRDERFRDDSPNGKILSLYGRPLFYHDYSTEKKDKKRKDLIFFTGRRWALTLMSEIPGLSNSSDLPWFVKTFHGHYSAYAVDFLSDPVDAAAGSSMPVELDWFQAKQKDSKVPGMQSIDKTQPSDATLICTRCDNEFNPCFFGEPCSDWGECLCSSTGSQGALCQIPPSGDGRCDEHYNKGEFDRDGGDCCENKCISGDHSCGRDESGFIDIGYFNCKPTNGDGPLLVEGSYDSLTSALSNNGAILVTTSHGPYSDEILIHDQDGSQWVRRTRAMVLQESYRRLEVTIEAKPYLTSAVANPSTQPKVGILIGAPGGEKAFFTECQTDGCFTSEARTLVAKPDFGFRFGESVGMSDGSERLAVSSFGRPSVFESGFVKIWGRTGSSNTTTPYELMGGPIIPQREGNNESLTQHLLSFALAGDGNILAISSGDASGHMSIQAYAWYENQIGWRPLGNPIRGTFCLNPDYQYGQLVALSKSGQTLAAVVGGDGVYVYDWKSDAGWVQREGRTFAPIATDDCRLEQTVELNEDGRYVAAGSYGSPDDSWVGLFKWDYLGNQWNLVGDKVTKDIIKPLLSLTSRGNKLALTTRFAYGGRTLSGTTRIYYYPNFPLCHDRARLLHVSFLATEETTWTLESEQTTWTLESNTTTIVGTPYREFPWSHELNTTTIVHEGGPYTEFPLNTVTEKACLRPDRCYFLTLRATANYKVFWDGEERENVELGRKIPIGNCN